MRLFQRRRPRGELPMNCGHFHGETDSNIGPNMRLYFPPARAFQESGCCHTARKDTLGIATNNRLLEKTHKIYPVPVPIFHDKSKQAQPSAVGSTSNFPPRNRSATTSETKTTTFKLYNSGKRRGDIADFPNGSAKRIMADPCHFGRKN